MQLNKFYVDFDFENLRRHRFEVIIDHFQTLLLHLDKLRRCINDVIWSIMRRMLDDRCVNNNRFDYRFVNQLCFDKTRSSSEDDETRQRQRLNDHFFWMLLTWILHLSLMSICIFRTRIWLKDCFTTSHIRTIVCMSNFFEFLVKWMSSYVINAKTISWRRVHVSQWACISFKMRQLLVMLNSYVNMLISFTKFNAAIRRKNRFNNFKKSTL
jgi:hypothetical protein